MVAFSILVPTFNRKAKLEVVLDNLALQEGIEQGEVIVGVDGSSDGTYEYLQSRISGFPGKLSFFWIENSGRAVIRNKLLEKARGEIIIFIQDDIVVSKEWLTSHRQFHMKKTGALVGHVTWYPKMEISTYMRWLESGGHLLDFHGIKDGDELDYWHFYMGNISMPKSLAARVSFDEKIPGYGWEDILYGYKFVSGGNIVYYSSSALAYHWDEYRENDFREYMSKIGKSALWAEQEYPGVGILPPYWKKLIFKTLISGGRMVWPLLSQEQKWYLDMKKWFLEAVEGGS